MIVAIVPLTVATIITNQNSREAMEKEILRQNSSQIEWVNSEFSNNVERIDEALTAFYFDNNIQFYLNKISDGDTLKSMGVTFFQNKLNNYLLANYRDFESVSFYIFEEGKAYHASIEKIFRVEAISKNYLNEESVFNFEDNLFYINNCKFNKSLTKDEVVDGPYMTIFKKRFEDQKIIAALVVKLKWRLFDKAIDLLNIEKGNRIFFVYSNGKVIYNNGKDTIKQDYLQDILKNIKVEKKENYFKIADDYVFYEQLSSDLFLIKTIPISIASDFYRKTLYSQLIIIFITGFLIISITIFLGRYLTKPILTLTHSMRDIDNLLNSKTLPASKVKSNDEIKVLEESYLVMLQKIKDLIDLEYKQKIEMQSAQLMALQAQINPHFMYNTLQMIGAMAVEKNSPEIYQIISAFSNMMRYNMRMVEELVTIDQELDNVDNYLKIQQMRFDRKLKINYEIEEGVKQYKIPKLSIQPIVENCFKHGFIKSSQEWTINIKVRQADEMVIIKISDNGQGIEPDKLREIRHDLQQSTNTIFNHLENLGLKNIDSRIKLFYGPEFGLGIDSISGTGTEVIMKISTSIINRGIYNDQSTNY